MSEKKIAQWLGFDVSTSKLAAGVRSSSGEEGFAAIPMRGAVEWNGQYAFDLLELPEMMLEVLQELERQGWVFEPPKDERWKTISWSVRQHDMVLQGPCGQLLVPSLSWQCDSAEAEAERLNKISWLVDEVGPIASRFLLPKLRLALSLDPALERKIFRVMTTGDLIGLRLTGLTRLSSSYGLCNGLMNQKTRELSELAIGAIDVPKEWFPPVFESGAKLGVIGKNYIPKEWKGLAELLDGWIAVAGLGDNHASAVGCGLVDESGCDDEQEMIVVSAGTSGTVTRLCSLWDDLTGDALCFDYYPGNRLLLMMLGDCAGWYNRFLATLGENNRQHEHWDKLALETSHILRIPHKDDDGETYPENWEKLGLATRIASTQFSIACELLLLVEKMLSEVKGKERTVTKLVLTGGLSQSRFFCLVFEAGVSVLDSNIRVMKSARSGPLAYETATYGALINGMLVSGNLEEIIQDLCPQSECEKGQETWRVDMRRKLRCALGVIGLEK